jgi:hypothetical protein
LMVVRVSDIGVCSFCVFTRSQARAKERARRA